MMIDRLERFGAYEGSHPLFGIVGRLIESGRIKELPEGRHEIDGDRVFALVARSEGRGTDNARLEAHRKYIDVQISLEGEDLIGWSPRGEMTGCEGEYDGKKDIEFFGGKPRTWIAVRQGEFAVFYPDDCHAPLAGSGTVLKAVIKVAA